MTEGLVRLPPGPLPAEGIISVTSDPSRPGIVLGGQTSGTIGLLTATTTIEAGAGAPLSVTDTELASAIRHGREVIRDASIDSTPVRLLVTPIETPSGTVAAVVIGDRTAELETLHTLLLVLFGGGLAVLAVSMVVGYVYAGHALVPIRESLRRQREFTADASHELRTPLTLARAAVGELRRGAADPALVERSIDDLDAGTAQLQRLVDDLLLLARTDAEAIELVPTATDLGNVAAEAAEALEPVAAERGVRIGLELEPAPLSGDEGRLRQLVSILVDNALRHSPLGGRVTVAVQAGATLVVEDDGPGIAPADLEHVFERFWRAPSAPPGGTGLGLAIARWIVERHSGSIRAENRGVAGSPGAGARFIVRLPA